MSVLKEIGRFFLGLNLDDEPRDLKVGEYLFAINGRSSKYGNQNSWQKYKGMTEVPITFPTGYNRCVGFAEDIENNVVLLLYYNSRGYHNIVEFNANDNSITFVMKEESILNFQIGLYVSATVLSGVLYWTFRLDDGFAEGEYNPPRMLDIEKAKKYTASKESRWLYNTAVAHSVYGILLSSGQVHSFNVGDYVYVRGYGLLTVSSVPSGTSIGFNLNYSSYDDLIPSSGYVYAYDTNKNEQYYEITTQTLDRIKHPPVNRPELYNETLSLSDPARDIVFTDGVGTDEEIDDNNLFGKLFTFRYRNVYADDSKSVWSPISDVSLLKNIEGADGSFTNQIINNVIALKLYMGTFEVKAIEVAVRIGNIGDWLLLDRLEKFDSDGYEYQAYHSYEYKPYYFYNNIVTKGLGQESVNKLQDWVPQISGVNEIIEKSRIIDSDITEGFDQVTPNMNLSQLTETYDPTNPIVDLSPDVKIMYLVQSEFGSHEQSYALVYDFGSSTPATLPLSWKFFNSYKTAAGNSFMRNCFYVQVSTSDYPDQVMDALIDQYNVGTSGVAFSKNKPPFGGFSSSGYQLKDTEMGINLGSVGPPYYSDLKEELVAYNNSVARKKTFKNKAFYNVGIKYFDRALRSKGVDWQSKNRIYFEDKRSLLSDFVINKLEWEIKNLPPLSATHYCIAITKQLTFSKYFDFYISELIENDADGTVEVDIATGLSEMQENYEKILLSYDFEPGDRIRFLYSYNKSLDSYPWPVTTQKFDYEILGVTYEETDSYKKDDEGDYITDEDGNKIRKASSIRLKIKIDDLDTFIAGYTSSNNVIYAEIYNYAKESDENFFYEATPLYEIGNPHSLTRYHKGPDRDQNPSYPANVPAKGVINGWDVFNGLRFPYNLNDSPVFVVEEAMYSDFYESKAPLGRPDIYNENAKRIRLGSSFRWGGKFIENTLVNNLPSFDYEDYTQLSSKFGNVTYMKEIGFVLKALQERKMNSFYIGRSGLSQAQMEGRDVVVTSDRVLGTHYPHNAPWGCMDPESVCNNGNNLYFFDRVNSKFIRDASNGPFPISEYKASTFFDNIGKRIKAAALAGSGVIPRILSAFDIDKNELTVLYHEVTSQDHSPIDVAIGQGLGVSSYYKGIVFSEEGEVKRWKQEIDLTDQYYYTPDRIITVGSKIISTLRESVFIHEQTTDYNNFYGDQKECQIQFIANQAPNSSKQYRGIVLQSNKPWNIEFEIEENDLYVNGMYSELKKAQFKNIEGKFYADILCDMKQSGIKKVIDLFNGRAMRGDSIKVTLKDDSDDKNILYIVVIKSTESLP